MNDVVELVGGGWKGPIAQARALSMRMFKGPFKWTLLTIPKLRLGHAAALLLFQGMKPQDFFPNDALIRVTANPSEIIMGMGLHILLAGTPTKPGVVPVSLEDVRIGHVVPPFPDITRDSLLSTMMSQIH